MSSLHRKSRIPALSAVKSKQPGLFNSTAFDSTFSSMKARDSTYSSMHGESSTYRFGQFSTQSNKNASVFKPNKYANCYSASAHKGKGLFTTTPKVNRQSIHQPFSAAASGRRSSISRGGDAGRQKDMRQLSDPKYQSTCITKLIQYLTENGYHSPIPPKFLKSPSKQDVVKVFEFLFSRLEPDVVVTPIETRVPELMAKHGYPYFMSKSTLVSFSSRQSIGNLLGMFEYLVDAARYLDSFDPILSAYPLSFDEVDVKCETLKATVDCIDTELFVEELAQKKYGTQCDLDEMERELEELQAAEKEYDEAIEEYLEVPKRLAEYDKGTQEYRSYNNYMEEYIASNGETCEKIKKEIEATLSEQNSLKEKKSRIIQSLKDQKYDAADIELARERQRQFDKEIVEDQKDLKNLKHSINATNIEISSAQDHLAKIYVGFVSLINSMASSLNVPSVQAYKPNIKEKLDKEEVSSLLERLKRHESLGYDIELRKAVQDFVDGFNQSLVAAIADISGQERVKSQQKVNQLDLISLEKEKEFKDLQSGVSKEEQILQDLRKQYHAECTALNEKFTRLRKELTELQQNNRFESKDRLSSLRSELSENSEMLQQERHQLNTALKKMFEEEKRIFATLEKTLTEFIDTEKKVVESLRLEVTAENAVLLKMRAKIEGDAKKAQNKLEESSKIEAMKTDQSEC